MPSAWEYVRAVLRHWRALMTGSLPIAVYTVLLLGFKDVPGKVWYPWNHIPQWGVMLLALLGLMLAQFYAWRDMKRDRDALQQKLLYFTACPVTIRSTRAEAFLQAQLNYPDHPRTDVFIFTVEIELHNESDITRPVFFPNLELLRKDADGFWQPFNNFTQFSWYPPAGFLWPKGFRNSRTPWLADNRYQLPARDITVADFNVMIQSPEGRTAFLGREFLLRISLRFIGLPDETIDIALPIATAAT